MTTFCYVSKQTDQYTNVIFKTKIDPKPKKHDILKIVFIAVEVV